MSFQLAVREALLKQVATNLAIIPHSRISRTLVSQHSTAQHSTAQHSTAQHKHHTSQGLWLAFDPLTSLPSSRPKHKRPPLQPLTLLLPPPLLSWQSRRRSHLIVLSIEVPRHSLSTYDAHPQPVTINFVSIIDALRVLVSLST